MKRLLFYDKNAKFTSLLIAIIVVLTTLSFVFIVYYDDYRFTESKTIQGTEISDEIVEGIVFKQFIDCENGKIEGFNLLFGTCDSKEGNLIIKYYSNDELIDTWAVDTRLIKDNSERNFYLRRKYNGYLKNNYLEITSNTEQGDSITVFLNSSGEYSGLYVNNKLIENTVLCYKINYDSVADEINDDLKRIIIFIVIIFLGVVLIIFSNISNLEIHKRFIII